MTVTAPPRPRDSRVAARLCREAELTARLTVDDLSAAFLPVLVFTAAACRHYGITGSALAAHLGIATALAACYIYVVDTSNQAVSGPEDAVNKPYRPLPRHLVDRAGLLRRFWFAMALYTILGWLTGTLAWVLLWQAVVIGLNLLSRPSHYLAAKPIAMFCGILAQLGAAWQSVAPLDSTGWRWLWTITIVFNLPMRYEDVRDLEGDRRVGRTTFPLLVGHWPVRIWFAIVMIALPVVCHLALFAPAHSSALTLALCDTAVAAVSWSAAVRSLLLRSVRADRVTYQLYCASYPVVLACGLVLLGKGGW